MGNINLSIRSARWITLLLSLLLSIGCSKTSSVDDSDTDRDASKETDSQNGIQENDVPVYGDSAGFNPEKDASEDVNQPITADGGGVAPADTALDASSPESSFPLFNPIQDAGGSVALPDLVVNPGGLEPGTKAPAPGDVNPNVYGRPVEMSQIPHDWETPSECALGATQLSYPTNPCIGYSLCIIGCSADSDCDDGGSGSATPKCQVRGGMSGPIGGFTGICELVCDDDSVCPDGMACVANSTYTGKACMWPADIPEPGCPAWCQLDPMPKDCPGWCAIEGVGCDPDEEAYCCEGLICSQKGWCVQEGEE